MRAHDDVIIAGGGPAGALTGLLLARRGARVTIVDRARFPRQKLCGDTLNPGALALLRRHVDCSAIDRDGGVIRGMVLSGPGGVQVRGEYGGGLEGRAMTRERFDAWLLAQAVDAGASLEEGALVDAPLVESDGVVSGVRISTSRGVYARRAVITIGADGRRSRLAWTSGLSVHPTSPRRWAIGAYYAGVEALTDVGEMHVRRGHYIGVAPLPGGLGNACLVLPRGVDPHQWRTPGDLLETFLRGDPQLGPRFRTARRASPVGVLGPMAVDSLAAGRPGLLLAGDAAGFIDPMTGDGIRLAFAGAELAADIAADVLSGRIAPGAAHAVLLARRRATLGLKWRFNRTLRGLVASPAAVAGAAVAARVCPPMFGALIRYAGDCA